MSLSDVELPQPQSPPEAPPGPDDVCLSLQSQFIWCFPSDAHKGSLTLYTALAESDFNSSAGVPPETRRAGPSWCSTTVITRPSSNATDKMVLFEILAPPLPVLTVSSPQELSELGSLTHQTRCFGSTVRAGVRGLST